ncbi:MAG: hypothetical protein LKF36_02185 [Lactobacillus sp.]|nr:hypothetical protein [Lactobacillus sp.]
MSSTTYHPIEGSASAFALQTNADNALTSLVNPQDQYQMNWVKAGAIWGSIKSTYDLDVTVTRQLTPANTLVETYTFQNNTAFDIKTLDTHLGIGVPLPDYYTKASVGLTQCCSSHIWCGEQSSYIMALRQGGEAPHLGLVLQQGALKGYSVERGYDFQDKEEEVSNNRGLIILHPENFTLHPGETYQLAWQLQWFDDKAAFEKILRSTPNYIHVTAKNFVTIGDQPITFKAHIHGLTAAVKPSLTCNGQPWTYEQSAEDLTVNYPVTKPGEYRFDITCQGHTTHATFLATPELQEIAEKRVSFIVNKQQCHDADSVLNGAYLIYDNEEHQQYYNHLNDHNGGRERVGMGVLVAHYLRHHPDDRINKSLQAYVAYVFRALFNTEDGTVYNDAPRNNDQPRLYNYPWIGQLFLEMYQLTQDKQYLTWYFKAMTKFYELGGGHFYAIGIPMYESIKLFKQAKLDDLAAELLTHYRAHADFITAKGQNYPEHEVAYEQSIVGPAAKYVSDVYRLTGDSKYQAAAALQLKSLDLFEGFQPDYHLNEVAIRHWDGYWFGKRRMLGDTFPHYWTALSGLAFANSQTVVATEQYSQKAQQSFKAVLSLFNSDGSASCAMVYPLSVNGQRAHFYDPWANDQDWGLYYVLKHNQF